MDKIYDLDEIKRIIIPILKNYGVSRAYLFGSYARGEATQENDIDLRIDGGNIKSMLGIGALYHELSQALNKPIDIVTTEAINHISNIRYTERFSKYLEGDECLIYEEERP